jgi:hypothetical protein
LANFLRLYPLNGDKFPASKAVSELGKTPAFWSDLARGKKSFGEKLARYIEERKSLVRLSLDDPQGAQPMPLSNDLLAHLASLPPEDRASAEALLRVHLKLPPTGPIGKRPDAA